MREIEVSEAARQLASDDPAGPVLVDVREADEWARDRIPGAVHLPMSRITAEFRRLPSDRPLLIHCAHGQRSLAVADYLARNGYPEVASVRGGIVAWEAAGLPVDRGPEADQ